MACGLVSLPLSELLQGFERNTSLTHVDIDWCREGTDDSSKSIEFLTTRNEVLKRTTYTLPELMDKLHEKFVSCRYPGSAIAVAFECLCARNNWAAGPLST